MKVKSKKIRSNWQQWNPITSLGLEVKDKKYNSIKDLLVQKFLTIQESQIIEKLCPNLEYIVYHTRRTSKASASDPITKIKVIVVIGNRTGIIGIGKGANAEFTFALESAIEKAKKNVILLDLGCGSLNCNKICHELHSIKRRVIGKSSSCKIILEPAALGKSLTCNDLVKNVLDLAGIKDLMVTTMGSTNKINTSQALYNALSQITCQTIL